MKILTLWRAVGIAGTNRLLPTVIGLICAIMLALPASAQEQAAPQTGTDPRDFAPKFMPYYRYTELENGLENDALTLFGLYAFTKKFAMTYEIPVGYKVDVTNTTINNGDNTCGPGGSFLPGEGLPPIEIPGVQGNCQEAGVGDMNLRFMLSSDVGWLGGDWIFGLQVDLPTATAPFLGTDQVRLGPMFAYVRDIPKWPGPGAFFALMNFYFFDIFKDDAVADTSMYLGRWFVMLPLSKKYKLYLLPEFQPIYDFENSHFSFWVGPEFGKMLNKQNIIYMKPGWGVSPDNLAGDRSFTFEIGWRYFMD
ncbi:MAG: hypothetical protein O6765_08500 [Gammaproteobacteria bacterium]|nr:hypothetical protein [Gammaproteobacteria bacterium]